VRVADIELDYFFEWVFFWMSFEVLFDFFLEDGNFTSDCVFCFENRFLN
jgi:hypothetical protein